MTDFRSSLDVTVDALMFISPNEPTHKEFDAAKVVVRLFDSGDRARRPEVMDRRR